MLVSEPVRGRSRATELPCYNINSYENSLYMTIDWHFKRVQYYFCTCICILLYNTIQESIKVYVFVIHKILNAITEVTRCFKADVTMNDVWRIRASMSWCVSSMIKAFTLMHHDELCSHWDVMIISLHHKYGQISITMCMVCQWVVLSKYIILSLTMCLSILTGAKGI